MNKTFRNISCNHAYVDGANLHRGTVDLGWRIDYKKFYIWLKEKYQIKRAYIFIGYIREFDNLYSKMRDAGFLVRFKETLKDKKAKTKGNCDADMVIQSVRDVYESVVDKSLIISSDGDFSGLVRFLQEKGKMASLLSPNLNCSILLKRTGVTITYLNEVRNNIALK